MTASDAPLVSIIIPTANRRIFARRAMLYAQRQTYGNIELVVVDSGRVPLYPDEVPRVGLRYVRADPGTKIGAARNLACQAAKGDIIVHFDDDDWQSPTRVARQVAALREHGAGVTQTSRVPTYSLASQCARMWPVRAPADFVHGASFAYLRKVWDIRPFPDERPEDIPWFRGLEAIGVQTHDSRDAGLFVYMVHGNNTASPKGAHARWSEPFDDGSGSTTTDYTLHLMTDDLDFYDSLSELYAPPERSIAPNVGAPR